MKNGSRLLAFKLFACCIERRTKDSSSQIKYFTKTQYHPAYSSNFALQTLLQQSPSCNLPQNPQNKHKNGHGRDSPLLILFYSKKDGSIQYLFNTSKERHYSIYYSHSKGTTSSTISRIKVKQRLQYPTFTVFVLMKLSLNVSLLLWNTNPNMVYSVKTPSHLANHRVLQLWACHVYRIYTRKNSFCNPRRYRDHCVPVVLCTGGARIEKKTFFL